MDIDNTPPIISVNGASSLDVFFIIKMKSIFYVGTILRNFLYDLPMQGHPVKGKIS
jgi:hypothetical protein